MNFRSLENPQIKRIEKGDNREWETGMDILKMESIQSMVTDIIQLRMQRDLGIYKRGAYVRQQGGPGKI